MVILGIDPGSRITGYGLIRQVGNKVHYIDSGCIRVADLEMPERLGVIFNSLQQIIELNQPDEVAIEQVFMGKNADSALKLGQARGAAMVAAVNAKRPVAEYSAKQVKQAVVGKGAAAKSQVQQMVQYLLLLSDVPQEDAADALAIAICHAHMGQSLIKMAGANKVRRGRVR